MIVVASRKKRTPGEDFSEEDGILKLQRRIGQSLAIPKKMTEVWVYSKEEELDKEKNVPLDKITAGT